MKLEDYKKSQIKYYEGMISANHGLIKAKQEESARLLEGIQEFEEIVKFLNK